MCVKFVLMKIVFPYKEYRLAKGASHVILSKFSALQNIVKGIFFIQARRDCPALLHEAATDCICSALYCAEVNHCVEFDLYHFSLWGCLETSCYQFNLSYKSLFRFDDICWLRVF